MLLLVSFKAYTDFQIDDDEQPPILRMAARPNGSYCLIIMISRR